MGVGEARVCPPERVDDLEQIDPILRKCERSVYLLSESDVDAFDTRAVNDVCYIQYVPPPANRLIIGAHCAPPPAHSTKPTKINSITVVF